MPQIAPVGPTEGLDPQLVNLIALQDLIRTCHVNIEDCHTNGVVILI